MKYLTILLGLLLLVGCTQKDKYPINPDTANKACAIFGGVDKIERYQYRHEVTDRWTYTSEYVVVKCKRGVQVTVEALE